MPSPVRYHQTCHISPLSALIGVGAVKLFDICVNNFNARVVTFCGILFGALKAAPYRGSCWRTVSGASPALPMTSLFCVMADKQMQVSDGDGGELDAVARCPWQKQILFH